MLVIIITIFIQLVSGIYILAIRGNGGLLTKLKQGRIWRKDLGKRKKGNRRRAKRGIRVNKIFTPGLM